VIRDGAPLFMIRYSLHEQLLSTAQMLLDDRLSDVDALAQVADSITAILLWSKTWCGHSRLSPTRSHGGTPKISGLHQLIGQ
jgi:hypothetical protein